MKFLIRLLILSFLIFIFVSLFIFNHGKTTLWDLLHRTTPPKETVVYSHWIDLTPDDRLQWSYVTETLALLNYQAVDGTPTQPRTYHADYPDLYIYTAEFSYPDGPLPAQLLHARFQDQELSHLEALPDHHAIPTWRLEPERLAYWVAPGTSAHAKVRLQDLPPYVSQAIIAMEDRRFYEHGALDSIGILRAVWIDLRQHHLSQGASTISQQLARSIFLNVHRTWTRKLMEASFAFYLEWRFTKPQLLDMYLNQVYWGQDGTQSLLGIEDASLSYFGKSAKELTLDEAALLAGCLPSPNHFSPRVSPQLALGRRNLVLHVLWQQGFITEANYLTLRQKPIHLAATHGTVSEAPYFVTSLQDELTSQYSMHMLMTQGWQIFTTLDPILQHEAVKALHPPRGQAALVALDVPTGAVLAWVGGTDFAHAPFDRVVNAKRQPGSAFKPFVYLAALDTHQVSSVSYLLDKPMTLKTPQGLWSPQNYDRLYRGKVTVRQSLIESLNVPTVQLALKTGLSTIIQYAQRCGIESSLQPVPALALGTYTVSVLELTSAYQTLANQGVHAPPYRIETIVDSNQKIIQAHTPEESHAVVSPASAFLITEILQQVFTTGTAKEAASLGFVGPAAGKTGTSENYSDAWFVGYTPRVVCGVWVGYDQPQSLGHSAASIALPLWVSFMKKVQDFEPAKEFPKAAGLVWKTVDTTNGMLARSGCKNREEVAFLPGTLPPYCTAHPGGLRGFLFRWRSQ